MSDYCQDPFSLARRRFLGHVAGGSAALLGAGSVAASPADSTAKPQPIRVLLVSTNVDKVGTNTSGTYLPELALPFRHFLAEGFAVDVATPKGGKAAIYSAGKLSEAMRAFVDSAPYAEGVANTLTAVQIDPDRYRAVYFPGGHGQYWDVVDNARIAQAVAAIHESGGVVGTAGHGAASLTNVRLRSGKYLVDGKRMTCFPWWAEKEWMNLSDYGKLLPFDMEEVLRRRNADLVVCTKETMNDRRLVLVADPANRLVTGSFASSAQWVAEAMVRIVKARLPLLGAAS